MKSVGDGLNRFTIKSLCDEILLEQGDKLPIGVDVLGAPNTETLTLRHLTAQIVGTGVTGSSVLKKILLLPFLEYKSTIANYIYEIFS